MARALRPIPLTRLRRRAWRWCVATWRGGIGWSLAVLAASIPITFLVVAGVSARESALVSIAVTTFGGALRSAAASRASSRCAGSTAPSEHFGFNLVLAVLLGTWASDIFAYFGGRLLGRHRLAPAISPNKTVEGFVIGLVVGIFTTWVTLYRQGFTESAGAAGRRSAWRSRRRSATSSSRSSSAIWASRTRARCWPGTAACSTASTPCSSPGPAALAIVALLGKA